ncbi:SinI family restriction endonuclease [Castellaniella caeni]|uniref:SinI family restriction endonuclease n=1 Tax=Castellaniella caeni TaxID=266123 RepID=UPI000A049475|nr:SinI family restriction endonuclease [Castellaniella caeni]
MRRYVALYGTECVAAAKRCGVEDPQEVVRFQTVCAFLADNPTLLSWRGNNKPDATESVGIVQLAEKFFGVRSKRTWPGEPSTVPDEAVSIVMQAVYGYSEGQTGRIKTEHQHAMSAENIVGALLERYIASVIEPHGWVWCAGDFVKAVDFIKYQAAEGQWLALQIKNRDNTENSSSAAIRHGTEIKKWFRSFSKKDATNWSAFPEPRFRNELGEDGFRRFLMGYLTRG